MEIVLAGEGDVIIRFIDATGQTLMQERLMVSGSPTVEGRRSMDLSVRTKAGRVMVAPVLISQTNPKQRVTFDGALPSRFTRERCKEIGCPPQVVKQAARGRVAPPARTNESASLKDDAAFAAYVQAAARRTSSRI